MIPLVTHDGIAAPLIRDNIDTDAIIPSREMKTTGKTGLADGLFAGWRYMSADSRTPNPDFVLNQPRYAGATILLGGVNFGCGSSREHAVWALAEFGIRTVIAPSFAPIFFGNCVRNGILPAVLDASALTEIAAAVEADPAANRLYLDLPAQSLSLPDGRAWIFPIDAEAKAMLVEGLDAIDLTFKLDGAIAAFHVRDRKARRWIYLEGPK
jgi:3-isopropylmalate/(R)-2-methylmalate dehydratase small subunit